MPGPVRIGLIVSVLLFALALAAAVAFFGFMIRAMKDVGPF